jgi:polar amino acid transport system permease protein
LVVGSLIGIAGASQQRFLRGIAGGFVEFNRNTPLLVKLFFIYFGFPRLGIQINEFNAVILSLTLHQGAYNGEIIRAGIQSLSKGQAEAGLSSGLTRFQVMRRIILPQAFLIVIPPLTTQIIETLKNTSLAITISIPELTYATQEIQTNTFRGFEAATVVTLLYCAMAGLVSAITSGIAYYYRQKTLRVPKAAIRTLDIAELV